MSVVLAHHWGVDVDKCLLAALLHDVAKPFPKSQQAELLENCRIVQVTDEDRSYPSIWHGMIAAQEGMDRWGVTDDDILDAVIHHSTGRKDLSPVGMVLYIADFTEPSRNWDGVEQIRADILTKPIREAAREVAQRKLVRLQEKGREAHPHTRAMADWLHLNAQKGN